MILTLVMPSGWAEASDAVNTTHAWHVLETATCHMICYTLLRVRRSATCQMIRYTARHHLQTCSDEAQVLYP